MSATLEEPSGVRAGRIAFLGGGFMGEGIIQGLIARGVSSPSELRVCDLVEARRSELSGRYGVAATSRHLEAIAGANLIVIAVKPQEFEALSRDLGGALTPDQIVVSIMAGVRIDTIRELIGHKRIVRAMPNTPGAIGEGFTGWTATPLIDAEDLARVDAVLGALGATAYFPDEKYLDMVTAVSGSGPGYVMLFVEAMIDAAVQVGLRRDVATQMVLHTFAGSARFALSNGRHPAEIRNAVTSPGGTTAAGLFELERAGVRAAIVESVIAALEKSRALGG